EQRTVSAELRVTNRVAIPQRREHLMGARARRVRRIHADLERLLAERLPGTTAPDGMPASTSVAGRWLRRLRASQPPRDSAGRRAPPAASARFKRSNMSRYLRSIT